jgi:hypothetical protein
MAKANLDRGTKAGFIAMDALKGASRGFVYRSLT